MTKLSGPQKLIDVLKAEESVQEEVKPEFKTEKKKSSPYQYALYLLSGQDYSEYKIRQKMRTKNFEQVEIDEAIEKLIEKKYLREEEYKRVLVKRLMRKGKADGLIKRQIEQEKLNIDSAELEELREETGTPKEEMLAQLVEKKMRGKSWPTDRAELQKLQQKIYRYILSRGFSFDDAKTAIKAFNSDQVDY